MGEPMDVDHTAPAVDVNELLQQQAKKFKTTSVDKTIDLDLGLLMASDVNPIDIQSLRGNREEYLTSLARDNTQLLLNDVWKLPTERVEGFVVAQLPAPTTVLPREKALPKPKLPTKWEVYAKQKGIVKKKRSRMVWDETTQEYKPRWGYKRVNDEKDVWCLPVPDNADPYEDQFEKRAEAKKERVAKNELQRLKNIARRQKGGVKSVRKVLEQTKLPSAKPTKQELSTALAVAKESTASVGKFSDKLRDEPTPKKAGKKRKFESVVSDQANERSRHLNIASKIGSEKPVVDTTRAVNLHIASEERSGEPAAKRAKKTNSGRRSKQGKPRKATGVKGKGSFNGKAGKPSKGKSAGGKRHLKGGKR